MYEDRLHAAMTVNPNALEEADERDRERARGTSAGRCTAFPIALKDNIHTTDMPTTGGALAFDGYVPPYEATLDEEPARRGRDHHRQDRHDRAGQLGGRRADADAGQLQRGRRLRLQSVRSAARSARGDRSTGGRRCRPAGRAPASAPRRISGRPTSAPRRPARSSARRTRTCSSAIKPTVGRISRYGVIPITADQDTAGPMARTVTDAAILLGALESPRPTRTIRRRPACTPPPGRDYTQFLKADGLKGARIGIPRAFYYDQATLAGRAGDGSQARRPERAEQAKVMAEAIAVLKQQGAVDRRSGGHPERRGRRIRRTTSPLWDFCCGREQGQGEGRGLLGGLQVRHEARLQRVAGDARRRRRR